MDIINIKELKRKLNKNSYGILFCIGTSLVSRLIQAKTRQYDDEIVPSHVALVYNGFIYESQSNGNKLENKKIPSGVRRLLLSDFFKIEKGKQTMYVFIQGIDIYSEPLEKYVHRPYGIDSIVDFLLKDKSDGDSKGLICSQYANLVTELLPDSLCPTPADLYRIFSETKD